MAEHPEALHNLRKTKEFRADVVKLEELCPSWIKLPQLFERVWLAASQDIESLRKTNDKNMATLRARIRAIGWTTELLEEINKIVPFNE